MNFNSKIKPQNPEKKQKKRDILINLCPLLDGRERVLDAFENRIFALKIEGAGLLDLARVAKVSERTQDKIFDHSSLKILRPKIVSKITNSSSTSNSR